MARFRRWRRSTRPPKPIIAKAAKISFAGLEQAYDWVPANCEFGVQLAFAWYDANTPSLLIQHPLDATSQKIHDRAVKARTLGDGNPSDGERRQAWITALRLYERIWGADNKLPRIDAALAPGAKPSRAVAWQQSILEAFKIFQPFGARYVPTTDLERAITKTPSEDPPILTVRLPLAELAGYRSILAALLAEAVEVAKQVSIIEAATGPALDGTTFFAVLPKVLEAVAAVVDVQKGVAGPPRTAAAKTGRVSARAPIRTNVVDPFGFFRTGTVKAAIAALLADRQRHTYSELENLVRTYGLGNSMITNAFAGLKKLGHPVQKQGKEVWIG